MRDGLGMDHDAMAASFAHWNTGVLDSYLIEITADILAYKDETAVRWSKRFSTQPVKKGPVNGPALRRWNSACRCR